MSNSNHRIIAFTARLSIRECREDDAPFLLRLVNDPDFLANIGDKGIRDVTQAREYVKTGPLASYAQHGFGGYCVDLRSTGETIGTCGILKRDSFRFPDLGYAFLPAHRGVGYAHEACVAVIEAARMKFGLDRLLAVVDPTNSRSIRLLGKLGFSEDGVATLPPDAKLLKRFVLELGGVEIRAAHDRDREEILTVHASAFSTDAESRLVARLLDAGAASPSLVAIDCGRIVGHVAFSEVTVDGAKCGGLGLAPLSVVASHRRLGVGARLVRAGLEACRAAGARFAVVLGEPHYYSRFGFTTASRFGLGNEYGVDAEFMAIDWSREDSHRVRGIVRYRREFVGL